MCLECTARVDFGDDYPCTKCACFGGHSSSAVSVSGNNDVLSGNKAVGGKHDRGQCTLTGSVNIVEVVLHRGVVDSNYRELELSVCVHCL